MSSVKEIIQEFCFRQNIPAPASFVGVNSQTERQYLSLFKLVGDQLKAAPFDWPQLKRTYIFNTQTNVSRYQLPGDFYRLLLSTTRDNTNKWLLNGPASDAVFALLQYGIEQTSFPKTFRLIGAQGYRATNTGAMQYIAPVSAGLFEINPSGSNNTDQLMIQYQSRNWVWPQSWLPSTAYTAGNLRTGINNIYQATTSSNSGTITPSWDTGIDSDGGVSWSVTYAAYEISSDDDIVLFDKDVMVEGLRLVYNAAKGADYIQILNDWINSMKSSFTRYNGAELVNASDEVGFNGNMWPNTPPGSWSMY